MRGWIILWPALALACGQALPVAAGEAEIAAGRKLALEICASCHVVAADEPRPPILSPPAASFADIAAAPDVSAASLRKFLAEPHGLSRRNSLMPPFLMPSSQVDAAVAYLMSLKPR
jgi:mono/diheme cytochrome c family protein